MSPEAEFICLLVAWLAFLAEAVLARSRVALGLAFWVSLPFWAALEAL